MPCQGKEKARGRKLTFTKSKEIENKKVQEDHLPGVLASSAGAPYKVFTEGENLGGGAASPP